jgi:hypothetical protein
MPWTLRMHDEHAMISHGDVVPWHVVFHDLSAGVPR